MSLSPKFLRLTGCSAFFVFASAFAAVQPSVAHEASAVVRHNPQADLPPMLQDFDSYVDSARSTFNVPGIAVAIVKDGKVVFEQGYGLREVGKPEKVDARTLFAIASNTKAFTAAALQMLAEQGKVDMDARVTDYLPWFQMSDPYVTHEMRVRDLLAHRSGLSLGAGDLLYWPPTSYTTKDVVERLAKVPLTN
jgi:CubicO group peptidase (beta-lactamase class C family)